MQEPEQSTESVDAPDTDANLIRDTSDDQLAMDMAAENHDRLRYIGQTGKWMHWSKTKWDSDHQLRVYTRTRKMLRRLANSISTALYTQRIKDIPTGLPTEETEKRKLIIRKDLRKHVSFLRSNSKIHNVVWLSRSDPLIVSVIEDWDSHPWLLNTPGGTVDLRTGTMSKHDPKNYITKQTAVTPATGEPTIWLKFIRQIMRNDEPMVRYLQKVFGYCLVGETKEHQMYFGYGTGANGKGVMLNTMRSIFGDYGIEASIETFTITQSDRHPTELAALHGARLVTCGETEDGGRWAEARIKGLTGGDPIQARFMRQDFFQYTPQFKLFLAGNHKPRLTNVDEAIERRFRLIPFTYTVPKSERDPDLFSKLKNEWPQILQWAIEGCLLWQAEGLEPPESVASATKGYMSQEDSISAWVAECCLLEPKAYTYNSDLYDSWRAWCLANGETAGTKRTLSRQLEDREPIMKIYKHQRNKGFGFLNIRLKDEDPDVEAEDLEDDAPAE
jgi:putative DNA primase/helicase